MIYVLLLVAWTSVGDAETMSKAFPSQEACNTARAQTMEYLEAHADEVEKSGIVSVRIADCIAVSNPATETKS